LFAPPDWPIIGYYRAIYPESGARRGTRNQSTTGLHWHWPLAPATGTEKMTEPEHAPVPKYLVPGLVAALIAWGLYLAIGAAFPEVGPGEADRVVTDAADADGAATSTSASETDSGAEPARMERSNFRPWRGAVV